MANGYRSQAKVNRNRIGTSPGGNGASLSTESARGPAGTTNTRMGSSLPPRPTSSPKKHVNKIPLSGYTTNQAGHNHYYRIDANGNGWAMEAVHPDSSDVRHKHRIQNFVIMIEQSECYPNCEGLYGVEGAPPHLHELQQYSGFTGNRTTEGMIEPRRNNMGGISSNRTMTERRTNSRRFGMNFNNPNRRTRGRVNVGNTSRRGTTSPSRGGGSRGGSGTSRGGGGSSGGGGGGY